MCENGIRNKKFSLVFTSVVLSPKHGESEESTGKVWENKTFQGQGFFHILGEAKIPTVLKTQNMGIVNLLSTGKLWENKKIPKVLVSYIFRTTLFHVKQKSIQFWKHGK